MQANCLRLCVLWGLLNDSEAPEYAFDDERREAFNDAMNSPNDERTAPEQGTGNTGEGPVGLEMGHLELNG